MEDNTVKVLLIDDDEDDYILIHEMLKDVRGIKYQVDWLNSFRGAKKRLDGGNWDVILVDYDLGGGDGLELIREAIKRGIKAPLIMVTGRGRYELDVEAMKSGAADYLSKDMINSAILERVIRYSIEHRRLTEILEQRVKERTMELQNALDELRIAEEELRTQHEELLQMNLKMADESRLHLRTMGEFSLLEVTTDREGLILEANNDAARLFRTDQESIKGKLLSLFIHLKDRKRFVSLLSRLGEMIVPRTETFSLRETVEGSAEWCLTVVPLNNQGPQTMDEYYWLFHPIFGDEG